MNKLIIPENHEIRCEKIRIYPDGPTHHVLKALKSEVRNVTNHMVRGREDVKNARKAHALKQGIGGPPPEMPEPPILPTPVTMEEKKTVREAWKQYYQKCKEKAPEWIAWYHETAEYFKDKPEFSWRDDSYQFLRNLYGKMGSAVLFRDVVKRVKKTKRANFKKQCDHIPLVWGNAPLVETTPDSGVWYGDRRGAPFYDALITVNGMKIPGRLRRPIPGKQVQGVTLIEEADGWYAVIKCIVPVRQLPEPTTGSVGVDVGQTDLVALSDGYRKRNDRDAEFVSRIAAIQEQRDRSDDVNFQQVCKNKVSREHQTRKRRITHWINSELLPKLGQASIIFIEKLAKNFKSDHGPLSFMHGILDAIKLRFQSRVREVKCAKTSQTCSQCGNHAPEARKGKVYACTSPGCEVVLDADINAARNIHLTG